MLLQNDIYSEDDACVSITGDNINFNCNGHTIYGIYQDTSIQILVGYNRVISNCNIKNSQYGIRIVQADNFSLINNTITNATEIAVYLMESKNGLMRNNFMSVTDGEIYYPNTDFWIFGSITPLEDYADYYVHNIDTSNLVGNNKPIHYFHHINNEIIENLDSGLLFVAASSNVTVRNNNVGRNGIRFHLVNDSVIRDNKINLNNSFDGWWIDGIQLGNIFRNTYNFNDSIINNTINIKSKLNTWGYNLGVGIGIWARPSITNENNEEGGHHLVENNTINGGSFGIIIGDIPNVRIINNSISNTSLHGIDVRGTKNMVIEKNSIISTSYWEAVGVHLMDESKNYVIENNIINVSHNGIYCGGNFIVQISNLSILKNKISNSYMSAADIWLSYCSIIMKENIMYSNKENIYIISNVTFLEVKNNIFSHLNRSSYLVNSWFDSNPSIELSSNGYGNFWSRAEYPYFCEYGNQNISCINNWDSNWPGIIDSCPYNQSYPPGEWPISPVCAHSFTYNYTLIASKSNLEGLGPGHYDMRYNYYAPYIATCTIDHQTGCNNQINQFSLLHYINYSVGQGPGIVLTNCANTYLQSSTLGQLQYVNNNYYVCASLGSQSVSGIIPFAVNFNLQGDYPVNAQFRWHFGNQIITNSLTSMQYNFTSIGNYNCYVEILQNSQVYGTSNPVTVIANSQTKRIIVNSGLNS